MQPSAERTVSVCASQRGVRTSLCDAVARDKCGTAQPRRLDGVQDWTGWPNA